MKNHAPSTLHINYLKHIPLLHFSSTNCKFVSFPPLWAEVLSWNAVPEIINHLLWIATQPHRTCCSFVPMHTFVQSVFMCTNVSVKRNEPLSQRKPEKPWSIQATEQQSEVWIPQWCVCAWVWACVCVSLGNVWEYRAGLVELCTLWSTLFPVVNNLLKCVEFI